MGKIDWKIGDQVFVVPNLRGKAALKLQPAGYQKVVSIKGNRISTPHCIFDRTTLAIRGNNSFPRYRVYIDESFYNDEQDFIYLLQQLRAYFSLNGGCCTANLAQLKGAANALGIRVRDRSPYDLRV